MEDLLHRIKANVPALEEWLSEAEDHWGEEDGVYRFYHQSWKVFDRLQPLTKEGFQLIGEIGGETDRQMNSIARSSEAYSRLEEGGILVHCVGGGFFESPAPCVSLSF
jgi:hypothetical protein